MNTRLTVWPVLAVAIVAGQVVAQDTVWTANADGNFGTLTNWNNGVPDDVAAAAFFGSDFAPDMTVTMRRINVFSDNTFTLARLYINPAIGGGNFAFVPGVSSTFGTYGGFDFRRTDGVAPRVDVTRGSHSISAAIALASPTTFDIASGAKLTTSGVISGDGGIVKDGDGTLYLTTENNTYRGLTTINDGIVVMTNFRSLGYQAPAGQGGPNGVVINAGATLLFDKTVDYAPSKPISVLGEGHNGMGALRVASGRQLGWQEVTFQPGQTTVHVESDSPTLGATVLGLGDIRGSGDVVKFGRGIFDLEIPSPSFTGTVTVREGLFHLRHFSDSLGQAKRLTMASQTRAEIIFDQFDQSPSNSPIERVFNPTPTTIGGFGSGGGVVWRLDDYGQYVTGVRGAKRTAVWTGNMTLDDDLIVDVGRPEDTMSFTGTIQGAGGITKAGAGTLQVSELTPRLLYVQAGTIRLQSGAADNVHRLRDFSVAAPTGDPTHATATIDLTNHYLVLDYSVGGTLVTSPYQLVRDRLRSGLLYGTGMISSVAPPRHRLGYIESSDLGWFNIGNEILDSTSLIVGLMADGDTNFDGTLSAPDYWALRNNFGQFVRTWSTGDFDYDGAVWTSDFNVLGANFGISAAPAGVTEADWGRLASAMNVPEPTAFTLLAGGTALLLGGRRQRQAGRAT
jgi:autotransporter-associated beta strand protein